MGISELLLLFAIGLYTNANANAEQKWFPNAPNQPDTNPSVKFEDWSKLHDNVHEVKMGVKSPECDDGIIGLTMDWDGSPEEHTCYEKKHIQPNPNHSAETITDDVPTGFVALHKCMNEKIEYNDIIPSFGYHRPLWGRYGEYKYLPKQRWLHNLEHGGVVMLYHPCADANEVAALKKLVKGCLYRHVITPYRHLPQETPLALLTWGKKLLMSKVYTPIVTEFIKKNAKNGPEAVARDGQFDKELTEPANIVSDAKDTKICDKIM